MKKLFCFIILYLHLYQIFGQTKYKRSLDSLVYYFQFVSIQHPINTYLKYQGFDSLKSITTFHKQYFFSPPKEICSDIQKSILLLNYKFHTCILDLNVFSNNSLVCLDSVIQLQCIDSLKFIFYNSNVRLQHGKGFFRVNTLYFKAKNSKYQEKFIHFLREAILLCNRKYKKTKIFNIRKYDMFDEINN